MLWLVLAAIMGSFVLAASGTWCVRAVSRRVGALDSAGVPGQIKPAHRSVPNTGGVAIVLAIVAPLLTVIILLLVIPTDRVPNWAGFALEHWQGGRERVPLAIALCGALVGLLLIGLVDDRRAIGAWPKLVLMLIVAGVIVVGFDVRLLELLDDRFPGGRIVSITLTILWLVAVTNAMNFMDNMDGVAASIGATAAAFFLVAAFLNEQWFVSLTLGLLFGALLGFLVFNFPPASIFMGDAGSLPIGFLLAFLTVRTTYVVEWGPAVRPDAWFAIFMPLVVLAIPLYDLVSVTLLRISQGRSPLLGDQQHFSHRLRDRGLSDRQTLAIIVGLVAVTGISGILLSVANGWQAILIGIQTLLVLVVLATYEHASHPRSGTPS